MRPGSVFVAMKGGSTDGNRYVDKAIAAGALGIVTDSAPTFDHLTVYKPACPSSKSNTAAARWRKPPPPSSAIPSAQLAATGITGTNGKTTTAFLTEALLNAAARKTVLVGTIEYHVAGEVRPSIHTTPESRDLFELMAEGVSRGATELVTEVSSHALDQGRMAGINFDVAVFTNLTRDHLDYHQTMEKYFAAKRLLFDGTVYPAPRVAVINAHDEYSKPLTAAALQSRRGSPHLWHRQRRLARRKLHAHAQPAQPSLSKPPPAPPASLRASPAKSTFSTCSPPSPRPTRAAFPSPISSPPSPRSSPSPAAFSSSMAGQPFTVIVDYAHTDDALRNLTALARQMTAQTGTRVITVFGCGGDRDRTKRPKMGQAAGEGSDFVVATSDNPAHRRSARHPRRNRTRPQSHRRRIHHRARPHRRHSPRARKPRHPATSS